MMISTTSQSKAVVGCSCKGLGTLKASKQVAMAVELEVEANPRMRCWNSRLLGHRKRDCPTGTSSKGRNGGQVATNNGNAYATNNG